MAGDFRIRVESDAVLIFETGTLDFATSARAILCAIEEAKAHDIKCLLFDLREADLSNYYSYIVQHAETAAQAGLNPDYSIAVVGSRDRADVLAFVEMVARNRGWRARKFHDPDEARQWLRAGGG